MNENILLSIQGVSKFYTGKTALNKVDMDVPKGEIFGLLGPNGAGKTSLIRIINQITAADEGRILFDGETLQSSHISRIGYLPEERGLYKKVRVIRQLEYFARLRGMSREKAHEKAMYWLDRMDLLDVKNKKTEELSKGMQQKIQFIVAVIHQPELLILDEPFSGFDPVNAELITKIILEFRQAGTTIIFSTHRMESVEKLCDSLALIHQSEKILEGRVSEIKQRFSDGTVSLETSQPLSIPAELAECLKQEVNNKGNHLHTIRLNKGSRNDLLRQAMLQAEVISFSDFTPGIHDIFIQLVSKKTNA